MNTNSSFNRAALALLSILVNTLHATAQTAYGGGDGSVNSPFIIRNTNHLDQLAYDVNNSNDFEGKYFQLEADLDYVGKTYTPIGGAAYNVWNAEQNTWSCGTRALPGKRNNLYWPSGAVAVGAFRA